MFLKQTEADGCEWSQAGVKDLAGCWFNRSRWTIQTQTTPPATGWSSDESPTYTQILSSHRGKLRCTHCGGHATNRGNTWRRIPRWFVQEIGVPRNWSSKEYEDGIAFTDIALKWVFIFVHASVWFSNGKLDITANRSECLKMQKVLPRNGVTSTTWRTISRTRCIPRTSEIPELLFL